MSQVKIRVGIIGAGLRFTLMRAMMDRPDSVYQLVAVADPSQSARDAVAATFPEYGFTSITVSSSLTRTSMRSSFSLRLPSRTSWSLQHRRGQGHLHREAPGHFFEGR